MARRRNTGGDAGAGTAPAPAGAAAATASTDYTRGPFDRSNPLHKVEMRKGKKLLERMGLAILVAAGAAVYKHYIDKDPESPGHQWADKIMRVANGIFYAGAGVGHFYAWYIFMAIMPKWFPGGYWGKRLAVDISGVAEIIVGLLMGGAPFGLVPEWLQDVGAWGCVALLAAVYPANVAMAFDPAMRSVMRMSLSKAIIRLPMQFAFAAIAIACSHNGLADTYATAISKLASVLQ